VGRRLAIKALNVTKFVLGLGSGAHPAGAVTEPLDRSMLAQLASLVEEATGSLDGYEYHRALERSEGFFWKFCDDYVELVKVRAYGTDAGTDSPGASARGALGVALSTLHRLFAPFLPFVTEEAWSWWQAGSVHRAPWPTVEPLLVAAGDGDPMVLDVAAKVLAEVRKAKTSA